MLRYTILAAIAALFIISMAYGANVERLVMPGDVIEGHAKYESECSRCHRPFSKATQKRLCLDCHEKLANDVDKGEGYHGISKTAKGTECRHCHTEHKGRGATVVLLNKETFDHGITDFPIKGAHAATRCEDCHKKEKKYRETPSGCFDCHKDSDRHREELGKNCSDCHTERSWKDRREKAKFDHEKTKFPLKETHAKTACRACHPNERYKKTPKDCYSCHVINDIHGERYGKKCGDCHAGKDWKNPEYDHGKTKFPLKGAHVKVRCDACHKDAAFEKKLETECYSCHRNDDDHKGRYGKKCADCHTDKGKKGWKELTFDHGKTDYPLRGKHENVQCDACHRGNAYKEKLPKECNGCHSGGDPHRGQQGKRCEKCHSENGWRNKVVFEHDITGFPLIGLHILTSCEECHRGGTYKSAEKMCINCHRKDDDHKKTMGKECARCHNPNGWKLWVFNHDKETKFTIDGAHKGLECGSCHRTTTEDKVKASKACFACHQEDDTHRGGYGLRCERCHSTASFKELKMLQ